MHEVVSPPGGRLGSILDGMCEQNFDGNGSFFQLQTNGMNGLISIQNGCHIGLVIQYGYLLPLFPIQDEPYFLI